MHKELEFQEEARQKLMSGIDILAKAVGVTLGPKGRNVIIEKTFGPPHITKDGVTVAKEIILEDRYENMGSQLLKDVASRTNSLAGDGTTTATILAQAIVHEGLKYVTAGANPIDLKRGIDKATECVIGRIKEMSQKVSTEKVIKQVATVSANNDNVIGNLIAEATKIAGKDGIISVEDASGYEDEIVKVEGMQIGRGYISPYFVNNKDKMTVEYKRPFILVTDKIISSSRDLMHIVEGTMSEGRPLLIFAADVDSEALATLVLNNVKGLLNVVAVKAPASGERAREILEDIAILTGAVIVSDNLGLVLSEVDFKHLGECEGLTITKNSTTIVGGNGDKEIIAMRVKELQARIKESSSNYQKKLLQERYSKLTGGIAIIRVGYISEVESKERKDRIEDSLNATRAAMDEGIIAGGGTAYIKCIDTIAFMKGSNKDESLGMEILAQALKSPANLITENAGKNGGMVVEKIYKSSDEHHGYDARKDTYCNLISAGIVDPTKVARIALQNAASVAGMFLTTECAVVLTKVEEKPFDLNDHL